MKNTFKKISAIAAAAFVSAALTIPTFSFADDPAPAPANPWVEGTDNCLDLADNPYFNKSLTIYNDVEGVYAYVPEVTYTYAVSTVTPSTGSTITDKNGNQAVVKEGVENGLLLVVDANGISSEPTDSTSTADTAIFQFSKKNTAVQLDTQVDKDGPYCRTITDPVYVVYDATKFETAGVYRYKISETTDNYDDYGITRSSAGVVDRYVDVYVHENPDSDDGELEVYGSVMFYENSSSINVETVKTDGFTNKDDPTYEKDDDEKLIPDEQLDPNSDPTTDKGDDLYTFNYTVKKVVKNSLIGTEAFPFVVTVKNSSFGATKDEDKRNQYFDFSTAEDKTTAAAAIADAKEKKNGVVNTPDTEVLLQNGEYLALTAVPANCTITVSETNNNDAVYEVTAVDNKTSIKLTSNTIDKTDAGKTTKFKTTDDIGLPLTNYAEDTDAKPTASLTGTTFTNTMKDISITGVLFMVAPFALMVAAAGLLIFVVVRSRKRDASDNAI